MCCCTGTMGTRGVSSGQLTQMSKVLSVSWKGHGPKVWGKERKQKDQEEATPR